MKVLHDSRDSAYRFPSGALDLGDAVKLAVDVWDAPGATVMLRTWIDGIGEKRLEMGAVANDSNESADTMGPEQPTRFQTTLTPSASGIVWYQFVIREQDGRELRYGAQDGKTGGQGRLAEWEPPSFLLAVCDPKDNLPPTFGARDTRLFENSVVHFLRGENSAHDLAEAVASLRENYPAQAWDDVFDLLNTNDCQQLFARLSGMQPHEIEQMERDSNWQLDDQRSGLAKGRLWCASLLQALAFGSTGGNADESTLAQRWELVHKDCGDIVRNAFDLRRTLLPFLEGNLHWFAVNGDVFGFWRSNADGESACVLINTSLSSAYDISVPLVNEAVSDVLGGYGVAILDARETDELLTNSAPAPTQCPDRRDPENVRGYALPHLYQLGTSVLHFHTRERLQRDMQPGVGVLAHITSLPLEGSRPKGTQQLPGTLGEPARRFIDWLAQAGVRYWQVLPVSPTDEYGSPYAGISAFAGNVRLLEEGFSSETGRAALGEHADSDEYRAFCEREADWLEPYACFMAIRQKVGSRKVWQDWPKKYRRFDPQLVADDPELRTYAETSRLAQFAFEGQWNSMRAYANERGVQIIGDMPIYVSADSADVWANPGAFQLGPNGKPDAVAGCPPDLFAAEGQVWGNPLYDWDALQANGYAWWMRRLKRAFHLYDWVRLDHFIGFARYFSIPAGEKATTGTYYPGPGLAFFQKAHEQFGQLPIIAEDLGSITPAIRALDSACGFPGMDIVQFVDGNDPLAGYQPRPEKIAYTGTHDNQTLVGYCAQRYPQLDALESAKTLIEKTAVCSAPIRIFPLQDVLLLDDEARMNVPGTSTGNWAWQAEWADLEQAAETMSAIARMK